MKNVRASALTLDEVAEAFAGMASARTTAVRAALVEGLLRRATPVEAKYLLKLMLGDMRTGVKQSLVEEGIAVAAEAPVAAVRHAVMLEADLSSAVRARIRGDAGGGAHAAVSSAGLHAGVPGGVRRRRRWSGLRRREPKPKATRKGRKKAKSVEAERLRR